MPRLIVIKGADEGKQFDLDQAPVSIGRDSTNGIRLLDTEISRKHAEFQQLESGGYRLLDLGSANGTFVNGKPAGPVALQSGDQIHVGQTILVFSAGPRDGAVSDLAERVSLISRQEMDISAAIVRTVPEEEGSRILIHPEEAEGAWLQGALANLAILYETSQAVSHILDIDELLTKLMDLLFRSVEADRGCIMLRDPLTGLFEPKAARWRQGLNATENFAVSRTVMDHVLGKKEGVLIADAMRDERFSEGVSLVRQKVCEVLCVPMKGRHETVGVLYLDTHEPAIASDAEPVAKFRADHLRLAITIAHQAALAIEETRYHLALVQAERLAAVGQTVAALSHHIKNILQGLRSGGEIVNRGLAEKDEPMLKQGWKIVEKNQGRIYDLVMEMLSFSKDREPALEKGDLNKTIRDVVELAGARAQELGVRLESRLERRLGPVEFDPEAIHRALLNIVGNALEAVEGREDALVQVSVAAEANDQWVRIQIADNGPGIKSRQLQDIFKPFHSTKGSRGTGLGLAVSRKILREHAGDILVHSQPGKGSKFILRLPIKSPLTPEGDGTNVGFPPN